MTSILSISLIAFLLLLFGLSIYNASSLSIKPKNFSFSVPLIHISSTESPFYNPSNTPEHLLRDGIQTSLARSRYFTERHYSAGKLKLLKKRFADGARLPLFKEFVMKYSIGTPPVETFSLVDTGNSLIWLQCLPCIKCYPQPIPIFDPTKSSSFKIVSCGTPECSTVPHRNCTPDGTTSCWFKKVYGDGTSTEGFISRDTFRLANSVGRPTTTLIHEMIFGCGYYNIYSDFPGVIGLGNAEYSLVGQLGYSRFSYFFTDQNHGWIHFGALAIISGSGSGLTTPFVPNRFGHYLLNLEAITVSGEKLNIPPETFQMTSDGEGGFIIDSGTSFTLLNSVAFSALRSRVREVMVGQVAESFEGFELCYRNINISRSSIFFPPAVPPVLLDISFNFKDMDFVVSQNNLWIQFQSSGVLSCLAFLNNHIDKISILGLYQQRNINVGYDLRANQLTLSYP